MQLSFPYVIHSPSTPKATLLYSSPTSPEVGQAQLQLLPGFVSGYVVGGRASFILGEKKQFSISNG